MNKASYPSGLPPVVYVLGGRRYDRGQDNISIGFPTLENHIAILKNNTFFKYVLIGGMVLGINFCYIMIAPFLFIRQFQYSALDFSVTLIQTGSGYLIGAIIASQLSQFVSSRLLIMTGLSITTTMSGMMIINSLYLPISPLESIIVPMFFTLFGVALIKSQTAVQALSPIKSHVGIASAYLGTFQILITGLVTIIFQQLGSTSYLFLAVSIMSISITCLIIFFLKTKTY